MTGKGLRRLIHVGTVALLAVPVITSWSVLRAILIACTLIGLVLETVRIRGSMEPFVRQVSPLFRPLESKRLSGAWWLSLGYTIAAWVPHPGAAAGIMVGALADPAASLAGSYSGRSASKTALGSGAALAVAILVLALFGLPWVAVFGGALIGTALERWSGPLDDNLLVSPGVALAVWFLA